MEGRGRTEEVEGAGPGWRPTSPIVFRICSSLLGAAENPATAKSSPVAASLAETEPYNGRGRGERGRWRLPTTARAEHTVINTDRAELSRGAELS